MGEKPPNIIGEGNNITMKQAPTVISFPPSQQFPEEFLELALLTQNSSAFSLIVVIFPTVSILTNSFALLPMHLPSTHLHQFPTPTINTSTINTTPLVAYTTALQIECIYLTGRSTLDLGVGIIQIKHDFSTSLPEWYSNILPLSFNGLFTISTATTGPTTATKASAFTTIPLPAAMINHSAASNINTTAPTANGASITNALENTTTDCWFLSIHHAIASIFTADADDFSTTKSLLLAIHFCCSQCY
jgi:hypothetical protein